MRSGTKARVCRTNPLNCRSPQCERKETAGGALRAAAPLDQGPRLLSPGPRLPAQPPGREAADPPPGSPPRPRPGSASARPPARPAGAASGAGRGSERGAEAAGLGLDDREAPAGRWEGCGGQAPGRPRGDWCPGCSHSLLVVTAVDKTGGQSHGMRAGVGDRPGGAWNAGFRSLHSVIRGRRSMEVFNSGRDRVR